ncbi:hypothetical protein JDV02_009274 [Purpureocillium takamizusanense]|uniref:Uncharacterized protein n=1 Tax=Purpureocillium takamizusanense TaxID=2060973 RepID=A0A9Q8QQI5_9HYPO|nr:uncharacterized protein JDV02_009274 [Purpureocillium takamizusanense]UNI23456.1 hypothetical protein JDV02_009274 [Purpureocillium takamizusanense]
MISFSPNCTLPSSGPGFVSAPNVRSTLDIVWSCVSILLLSSWSIQHLNVPPQFEPKSKRQVFRRRMFFLFRKLKWMLATLVAPETLFAFALTDYVSAHEYTRALREAADADGVPWSKTHTYFADMGGVISRPRSTGSLHPGLESEPQLPLLEANAQLPLGVDTRHEDVETQRPLEVNVQLPLQVQTQLPLEVNTQVPVEVNTQLPLESNTQWPSEANSTHLEDVESQAAPDSINTSSPEPGQDPKNPEPKDQLADSTDSTRAAALSLWRGLRRHLRVEVESASWSYGRLAWRPSAAHTALGEEVLARLATRFADDRLGTTHLARAVLRMEGDVWVLSASQLYEAWKSGLVGKLPHITEDDISDKSKGDALGKVVALIQVSWLVLQLVARAITGKSSTPLEVMTLSFAVCTFIIYILLLDHPQDVMSPVYIRPNRSCRAEDMETLARVSQDRFWGGRFRNNAIANNTIPTIHLPSQYRGARTAVHFVAGAGIAGVIFGSVHLVAWNMQFPTKTEEILWKVSALFTALAPVVATVVQGSTNFVFRRINGRPVRVGQDIGCTALLGLQILAFVLARAFLVVEAFRSLYFLPPDAFRATWAANIPHVG